MAEGIGVAATGGTNSDGSRWVSYDCGDWEAVAQERQGGSGWDVYVVPKDHDIPFERVIRGRALDEATACLVAEAVAVAVAHVLQQAMGPAVEEEGP